MLPMTANDTFANITLNPLNYCDNANMFFIDITDKSKTNLLAIAGIVNSTLFSVMARSIALAQQNGYFKFNKQFIEPIAFPKDRFQHEHELIKEIAQISQEIQKMQEKYIGGSPKQKNILKATLKHLWNNLDNRVFELYELDEHTKTLFVNRGRNVDRVEVLNAR